MFGGESSDQEKDERKAKAISGVDYPGYRRFGPVICAVTGQRWDLSCLGARLEAQIHGP